MANVYVTRYENMKAFSTARKAIESVCHIVEDAAVWEGFMGTTYTPEGHIDESIMLPLTMENVPKLITLLNSQGFLMLYSGSETMEIEKLEIM